MIPRQASEKAITARRRWLVVSRGIQACVFLAAVIGVINVWKHHIPIASSPAEAPATAASTTNTPPLHPQSPAISKLAPDASGIQANANQTIVR